MATVVERFQAGYQQYHGLSAKWCNEQTRVIEDFLSVTRKSDPADLDAADLRAYMGTLQGRGLAVNTVRKKGNMLRAFYGWLYDEGIIDGNTLMAVKRVENPKGASAVTKPKPYSRKELRQFWDALDSSWPETDPKFIRRWQKGTSPYRRIATHAMRLQIEAIIRLALDCGLRRQEIYNATLDDIHPDNEYVVVRFAKREAGGEDKMREVPYTDKARTAVHRWIEFRSLLGPTHDRPWLSLATTMQKQRKYLDPMRWERFERLTGAVIPPKGTWHLHRFRHTCATEWLRADVPIELVSRLLGHSNINQTLCYAQLVTDDIHRAMAKAQPAFEAATSGVEATTPVGGKA